MSIPEGPRALPPARQQLSRRITSWFTARPRATVRALLSGPLGWIGLVYLGSLVVLLLHAFWVKE